MYVWCVMRLELVCCGIPYVVGRPEVALELLTYSLFTPLPSAAPPTGQIWVGKEADSGAQIAVKDVRGDSVLWLDEQALTATAFIKDGKKRPCSFHTLHHVSAVSRTPPHSPGPLLGRVGLNYMDVRPAPNPNLSQPNLTQLAVRAGCERR